ncbi:MAG: exported protein of unknown function, partial [Candidatus Saccharibacteria bacterium]|nr:exported protein of unknown function [Candidatus Saccharibacteria bacterium]
MDELKRELARHWWIHLLLLVVIAAAFLVMKSSSRGETSGSGTQAAAVQQLAACTKDPCVWKISSDLTAKFGPTVALDALAIYQQKYPSRMTGDSHEWAHVVGRQTAVTFGISGQSFLKCPTMFNYGCMHGFFEEALGHAKSTKDAVDQICGKLETNQSYSEKFKFYCYHGVGHGIMQSTNYDLGAALTICDSISTPMGQDGCWQGVFMENINAEARGEAQAGVFSTTDPLAPCDKVADKYQHECYINHAAHLVQTFNSVSLASSACLKASSAQVTACLESIGLMATNPVWQEPLDGKKSGDVLVRARDICKQFPNGHNQA